MSGFGPALACLAAALALHLAVLAGFDPPQSASGAGGEGGDAAATLRAAPGDLTALVAAWDSPPTLATPPATPPATPEATLSPPLPMPDAASPRLLQPVPATQLATETVPRAPAPPPQHEALPSAPTADAQPADTQVEDTPTADAEPAPALAPAAAPAPAPRPALRAAGAGQGQATGTAGSARAATASTSARQSALAAWGAEVRAALQRRQRSPVGGGEGAVTLLLAVARNGALQSVEIAESSGSVALDQAALAAARAAAPFAAAPPELTDAAYALRLTLRFIR
ncbi:TonB family protein [Phaeovulum sp.]|uniref:TonB family protein n=1 Tax=Phaeovulum sp. TaxID=2934796 RepID=UPI00356950B7